VEALKSKGADSSYASRKKLAEKLGISGYTGTAAQNVQMIKKLGGRVG
jgi:biotin operon repressor